MLRVMSGASGRRLSAPGPFRAEHIPEGSPYELSDGHPVLCMPTGRRGSRANLVGGQVLETDPAVKSAGVDLGYSRNPSHLRAPDVSVGDFADEPGWSTEAPPLAVEYADTGQDEAELKTKIAELLEAGQYCAAYAHQLAALKRSSSCSRSTRRCTLPVVVMGSASMNSISLGYS